MIHYYGSCETRHDYFGNKAQLFMCYFKKIHLGLIKVWLCYELYNLIDKETKTLIKDNNGKVFVGKHLSSVEINWSWK